MANKFTNFLKTVAVGNTGNLKDYQHAARLYVDDTFKLAPKAGWLYYVSLGINQKVKPLLDKTWVQRYVDKNTVGLLAKNVDLPRFSISTETLNQYNKKTVVQTKIAYQPISITFHDDMANVITNLWDNYYRYYYADGNYIKTPDLFGRNTMYDERSSAKFGFNKKHEDAFFTTIDVYLMNQKQFTKFTLVNPIIKSWSHDPLDQSQSNLLGSKMEIEYEGVLYDTNLSVNKTNKIPGFAADHYDRSPSPLSVLGGGTASLLGEGGVIAGIGDVFGELGEMNENTSIFSMIGTGIKAANTVKNARKLTGEGLKQEGYSILGGVLGDIKNAGRGASLTDTVGASLGKSFSPVGVLLSKGGNSSTNDTTSATPKNPG